MSHEEMQGENELAVAVVGMAGRFPGAGDIEAFWRNLRAGVESITFFSEEELSARGVPASVFRQPGFVRASPVLEGIARFDAALFGYSPREAEQMDPQHRMFLECAWAALEHAGCDSTRYPGSIGVVAGTSISSYLLFNLLTHAAIAEAADTFPVMVGNDKDFLATRAAYHLHLRGPSLDVQTGCSTSLVSVHLACQLLQSFQCDMALAGGVSVHVPQRAGYVHEAGGITSPDGHCRAFDAKAGGTLFGSGVGMVVLKRLEDALAEGDAIYAVIKGSAINNDGAAKLGFTAPSAQGQTEVIARAHAMAGVPADTIDYVEAHGTGTALGDPIEVAALTQAFRGSTDRTGFCALGSVKSNIGHLDAAAGIAGLIKTVQALRYRELPPTLHFDAPNPEIDFEASPFYVNGALRPWPSRPAGRRAGVSSFGIGGTNAHVVLEEAPPVAADEDEARGWQVLPLSAKTRTALDAQTDALGAHLAAHPEHAMADAAFTLQTGRRALEQRRVLIVRDREDAIRVLRDRHPGRTFSAALPTGSPEVVFMFAGGGAQHAGMGHGLYESEPVFRQHIDRCAELGRRLLGVDLRAAMYPEAGHEDAAARQMKRTSIGLPALFAVQSAMAELLAARGVRPSAMIGHSLGEYAAAWLAGVLSLDDAMSLVVRRGQLFEQLPAGRMLGVALSEADVRALDWPGIDIAAVNGPANTVVAGTSGDIEALAAELERREIEFRHIAIDVAAHSHLVEPVLARFRDFVASLRLSAPSLPFVSNVTGDWITAVEATDPDYWTRHLRSTVRFGAGVGLLLADPRRVLLEVGPNRTLSTLAKLSAGSTPSRTVLASMRHPHDATDDAEQLAQTTGRLWLAGVNIAWEMLHTRRRRVPLPTYPFEGKDYWIAPERGARRAHAGKRADVTEWFYQPSWERRALTAPSGESRTWLVVGGEHGLGDGVARALAAAGHTVVQAELDAVGTAEMGTIDGVVHLAGVAPLSDRDFAAAQARGYTDLLRLSRLLGEERTARLEVVVVGSGALEVESADRVAPERATVLAACKVLPQEDDRIRCRYVDVQGDAGVEPLVHEVTRGTEPVVALRGPHRWVQRFVALPLPGGEPSPRALRPGGVYLITGGLGRVGFRIAEHLARTVGARLVLVTRSGAPKAQATLAALESSGAQIVIERADVADEAAMRGIVERTVERFGALHGVVHAAGLAGEEAVQLAHALGPEACASHFHAKTQGTEVLARVLEGRAIDFCMLVSSIAGVLGGIGLAAYTAANTYLDAFAAARVREAGAPWISVGWDHWPQTEGADRALQTSVDRFRMTAEESVIALERILTSAPAGHIVVSTGDLEARWTEWVKSSHSQTGDAETVHARPDLGTEYAPPGNDLERSVVAALEAVLGLDRIGVHDNFFDLGGNSLLWLKVAGRLKKELGRDVPLTAVFEAPSAVALAALLGRTEAAPVTYEESQARGAARRARRNRMA